MRARLIFAAMISFATGLSALEPPAAVRGVQVAFSETQADAEAVKARLVEAAFAPVEIVPRNDGYVVFVGRCETLPEATLLKHAIRRAGFEDAFEKSFPEMVDGDFTTLAIAPEASPLRLRRNEQGTRYQVTAEAVRASSSASLSVNQQQIEARLEGGKDSGAIAEAREQAVALADTDQAKGRLLVKMGRALVQRDKKAMPSMPHFLAVARGEIAATPAVRREAALHAADGWHYYYFRPLQAYAAYLEILDVYGDDPAIEARARVEIAACLMELARNEAAYFNEVRRACDKIRERVSPEYARAHAVADLMRGESFFFEGDHQLAADSLREFDLKHPASLREIAMARWVRSTALGQLGRYGEASAEIEELLAMDLGDPRESYYWQGERMRLQQGAAAWLAWYKEQLGQPEEKARLAAWWEEKREEILPDVRLVTFDYAFPSELYELTIQEEVMQIAVDEIVLRDTLTAE